MAVWRRKPKTRVIVHPDQGSQYGSDDWKRFCLANHLEPSMSRRGNCWDNAVVESFFSSLKKECIRKRIYKTRDMARADVFDYIEVFTTERVVTVTWAASALRPLKAPHFEAGKCLRERGSPDPAQHVVVDERNMSNSTNTNSRGQYMKKVILPFVVICLVGFGVFLIAEAWEGYAFEPVTLGYGAAALISAFFVYRSWNRN